MANNYSESSSFMKLDPKQVARAQDVLDKTEAEILAEDDDYESLGLNYTLASDGIWFCGDGEYINTDHLELLSKALVEELDVRDPFLASWSYTCSKPRVDEFGGGAMAVIKGHETVHVDAMYHVREEAKKLLKREI